jgi:hypothetical protein
MLNLGCGFSIDCFSDRFDDSAAEDPLEILAHVDDCLVASGLVLLGVVEAAPTQRAFEEHLERVGAVVVGGVNGAFTAHGAH